MSNLGLPVKTSLSVNKKLVCRPVYTLATYVKTYVEGERVTHFPSAVTCEGRLAERFRELDLNLVQTFHPAAIWICSR